MKKHIPNSLTSLNLLCGWLSIYFSYNHNFKAAICLIIFASVFDFLDGFVAKKLNVQSEIGAQLDSFADLITFGTAPAILIFTIANKYFVILNSLNQLILYSIIGLIPVFSAIRLAKFNVLKEKTDSFIGLPTPAFALITTSISLVFLNLSKEYISQFKLLYIYIILSLLIALLMVTKWRFISFKFESYDFSKNKWRFFLIISALISSVLLLLFNQIILIPVVILCIYIVFSICYNFTKQG